MKWSIKRPFSPLYRAIYEVKRYYYASKYPAEEFKPKELVSPGYLLPGSSAWKGLDKIIPALISQLGLETHSCIEFGVEKGYSTAVFAQYFDQVTGVDTFQGDRHAGFIDTYGIAGSNLNQFKNITLIKDNYQHYTTVDHAEYNLCHVDIIHTYEDTYACGEWAVRHAKCVIFHDTISFGNVRKAVYDLSVKYNKKFLNYSHHHGLGILI